MAFRTQKISQMTPKGADLEATDLIEVSTIESGSYVTRSITGQELIDAIPLPPSGLTVGTTPIASGTIGRVLFEGTGNVLQESANLFWNNTNNRLGIGTSSPAYSIENVLPNVFGGSNVGLLISDFNLSFSGSSSWLAWGRSNTQLGQSSGIRVLWLGNNGFEQGMAFHVASSGNGALSNISGSEAMRITNTKNVLINTTTDAGFRLDVNGTARVSDNLTVIKNQNLLTSIDLTNTVSGANSYSQFSAISDSASGANSFGKYSTLKTAYKIIQPKDSYYYNGSVGGDFAILNDFATGRIKFATGGASTAQMTLFSTGNFAINTTTDAGFKLDVNGTARFTGSLTMSNFTNITSGNNGIAFETFRTIYNTTFNTIGGQYGFNFDDGGGSNTSTSGTTGRFQLSSRFAPTSGTAVFNTFLLNATINQTGGANGITRGLYVNPTLTAAADFRAIETARGNVVFGNLPTSPVGLPTGAIWNNLGVLMIV